MLRLADLVFGRGIFLQYVRMPELIENIDIKRYSLEGFAIKKSNQQKLLRAKRFSRGGIIYIWVMIILLMLITIIGLALDIGKVAFVAHQLQNAADAAALGGARVVKISQSQARQNAIDVALLNYADGQNIQLSDNEENNLNGDIVVGRYDLEAGTFTVTTTGANALKVSIRYGDGFPAGPVSLNFGSLFNVDTYDISRSAIAVASGGTGAGMIALADEGIGLKINGSLSLNVQNGAILVNSADDNAVRIIGQPELDALELDVTGDVDATGGFEFDPNFPVNTGVEPTEDPICPDPLDECLPEPLWDPAYDLAPSAGEALDISGGTVELEPGYYSGGLRINGGDVTLKPGIYILDGSSTGQKSGLVLGGNANICAKGVMFYVVGDGVVDIAGFGSIQASPIKFGDANFCDSSFSYPGDIDYTYEDMTIFQARDNFNGARIVGTGLLDLEGTLYFPDNLVDLSGSGEGFGDQLIADTIEISGTGNMVIKYDGRNRAPANKSFLVE